MGKDKSRVGGHRERFDRLCEVVRGGVNPPKPELDDGVGGPLNYKAMEIFANLLSLLNAKAKGRVLADAIAACVAFFREQLEVGHWSLQGPKGFAVETSCPGAHDDFTSLSVIAGWEASLAHPEIPGLAELAVFCEDWIARDVRLDREFFGPSGETIIPCNRAKDGDRPGQPIQEPKSVFRDARVRIVLGGEIPGKLRKAKSAAPDHGMASGILWRIMTSGTMEEQMARRERMLAGGPPNLFAPIHRAELPEGGFQAWLEDNSRNRQFLFDVCNWVKVPSEGAPSFGYDWDPMPPLPEGCDVRIIGGSQ